MDDTKILVKAAHELYDKLSIIQMMYTERQTAICKIIEFYGPQDLKKIDKYLNIIDKLYELEDSDTFNWE